MADRSRGGGCVSALLNVLALFVFLIILLVIAGIIAIFLQPDLAEPVAALVGLQRGAEEPVAVPTAVERASVPTATEVIATPVGLSPTWTPRAQATVPPTATNTRRPTGVPSITPTVPPRTATPTPTDTPTATPTPGPSPTPTNTRSQFPFTKTDDSPIYLQNFANNAGCDWLGIAGEVLDLEGRPVPNGTYQVHVWGSGIDERVPVGGAPAYGPSAYERSVDNAPAVRDYNLQMETTNGTAVSQVYQVQTRASCNQNLLLFNFVQNH